MANPSEMDAIQQWPIPTIVRRLFRSLGLLGYYQKFIKGYASIVAPLVDMLKRDAFEKIMVTQQAFDKLRITLIGDPILALPDFTQEWVIEANALCIRVKGYSTTITTFRSIFK